MARKRNKLSPALKNKLVEHIHQQYGRKLAYSHECEKLSEEINAITGDAVAPNTLRRFLGFLKADFSPSANTLHTLARYCGCSSWHHFAETASQHYQPLTLTEEAALYLDFYAIQLKSEGDMNYHNATRNIALRILFNPQLLSALASPLAKNPVSQVYFFERFPYIDGLGMAYYKKSLYLYLQKKTDEAQIFGNCLLFLSAFLCRKNKEMAMHYTRLCAFSLSDGLHPFVVARYIGTHILYACHHNENVEAWLAEAEKWNKFFLHKSKWNFWHYPYFQHMMCDYLNLAGLFGESYRIIRSIHYADKKYEIEQGYEQALEVTYAIAHHSVPSFSFAKWFNGNKVFNRIHPLFKKYYELQALCLYRTLATGKKKEKLNTAIRELVHKTGFHFFEE